MAQSLRIPMQSSGSLSVSHALQGKGKGKGQRPALVKGTLASRAGYILGSRKC